jgi:putative ABC transport system substrate-binding protein
MRRREFITLIGGAAAMWSLGARAQEKTRVYRIVVLNGSGVATDGSDNVVEKAFKELGWSLGRNLEVEYRWGAGNTELNEAYAKELIAMKPDAILAVSNSTMAALHREASSIPTVFVAVSDPVGMHYVDSLARPGRNVTGLTPFEPSLGNKWMSLLKEIAPNVENVGLIFNPEPGTGSVRRHEANSLHRLFLPLKNMPTPLTPHA